MIIPADISIFHYACHCCGVASESLSATHTLCAECLDYVQASVDAYNAQQAVAAEERADRQSDTRQLARAAKVYVQAGNDIREMQCNGFRRTHTRASTRHAKRASHKAQRRLNRAIIREQA